MDRYDKVAQAMARERQAYVKKVQNGRRVAKEDPSDPEFSDEAETVRQGQALGVLSKVPYGPPKPGSQFSGR